MSALRIVDAAELRAHVSFHDLIEPVATAFKESSAGLGDNGLVAMFPLQHRDRGDVYVKTGTLRGHSIYIVKVSPWFAINVETGSAQGGFIGVFDSQTGRTLAILNEEHYLSDIRTAAAGALAARLLAPREVRTASVLGAGVQAYWQVMALHRERSFDTLIVWARNTDKAAALKTRLAHELPSVSIFVEQGIEDAVRRADVVICATLSREPLVHGDWLHDGQHITAVGADDPSKCELDVSVLRKSRIFVDSVSTNAANGDIHRAITSGRYAVSDIGGEIGELLAGAKPGRISDRDITVAKFVGIGVQDLAAAEVSLQKLGFLRLPARESRAQSKTSGTGVSIPTGQAC
jgi:ornithine cyclodeaminase/alanine dehydrogenase-like protein (mu-crystallin family)